MAAEDYLPHDILMWDEEHEVRHMATGVVNEIGRSKNGKPKVKIDGRWFFLGRCSSEGLSTGIRVEYDSNQFAENLWGLQSWKKIADAPSSGSGGSAVSDDAEMRFISNVVGQALAAGTITKPEEIRVWANAARKTLQFLKVASEFDFDDEIPEAGDRASSPRQEPAGQNPPTGFSRDQGKRDEMRQAQEEYAKESSW